MCRTSLRSHRPREGTFPGRQRITSRPGVRSKGESMRRRPDTELIVLVSKGATEAAEVLFDRYWTHVWRSAYAVTAERGLADEAAQEAIEKAFGALHGFDETRPLGPWLERIAVNRAVDPLRRRRRARRREACRRRAPLLARPSHRRDRGRPRPSGRDRRVATQPGQGRSCAPSSRSSMSSDPELERLLRDVRETLERPRLLRGSPAARLLNLELALRSAKAQNLPGTDPDTGRARGELSREGRSGPATDAWTSGSSLRTGRFSR